MGTWSFIETQQPTIFIADETDWSTGIHRKVYRHDGSKFDMSDYDAVLLRIQVRWVKRQQADGAEENPQVWPMSDPNATPLILAALAEPDANVAAFAGFAGRELLGANYFRPSRRIMPAQPTDDDVGETLTKGDPLDLPKPAFGFNKISDNLDLSGRVGLWSDVYAHARTRPQLGYDFGPAANQKKILHVTGMPPIGELHFVINFLDGVKFKCSYTIEVYALKASSKGPP